LYYQNHKSNIQRIHPFDARITSQGNYTFDCMTNMTWIKGTRRAIDTNERD
jgi:hypothetical protein